MVLSVRPGVPDEETRQTTAVPGRRIYLADASESLRSAVRAKLVSPIQSDTLIECANGFDLLAACVGGLCRGEAPSLIITDVRLQILDGKNAALLLRAAEEAFEVEAPTPIVFFTELPRDEALKRLLAFVGQAHYVQKVASESPEQLAQRLADAMQSQ